MHGMASFIFVDLLLNEKYLKHLISTRLFQQDLEKKNLHFLSQLFFIKFLVYDF